MFKALIFTKYHSGCLTQAGGIPQPSGNGSSFPRPGTRDRSCRNCVCCFVPVSFGKTRSLSCSHSTAAPPRLVEICPCSMGWRRFARFCVYYGISTRLQESLYFMRKQSGISKHSQPSFIYTINGQQNIMYFYALHLPCPKKQFCVTDSFVPRSPGVH